MNHSLEYWKRDGDTQLFRLDVTLDLPRLNKPELTAVLTLLNVDRPDLMVRLDSLEVVFLLLDTTLLLDSL